MDGWANPLALHLRTPAELATADNIARWDALAPCAAEPNPFLESWYALPAQRALDPDGELAWLVLEGDGIMAGIIPLLRQARYYRYPAPNLTNWVHGNCFVGSPLVAAGCERHFWRALLDWCDRHAGCGLFLHLTHMPLDGPLHSALLAVCAEQRRTAQPVHHEERAMLASPLTPEQYWQAALNGKRRKELRRQASRLAEAGDVRYEREDGCTNVEQWGREFLALELSGWKGREGSALAGEEATISLFLDALQGAAQRGRLERLTLRLDGRPVAMLASFICPPGCFSFKTAYDERYARFSPGVLLQQYNLQLLERGEIAWCDSCASANHPMIDRLWMERRPIGRINVAIGGALRRRIFRVMARAETRKGKRT